MGLVVIRRRAVVEPRHYGDSVHCGSSSSGAAQAAGDRALRAAKAAFPQYYCMIGKKVVECRSVL